MLVLLVLTFYTIFIDNLTFVRFRFCFTACNLLVYILSAPIHSNEMNDLFNLKVTLQVEIETVRDCQCKDTSILWSHHEETRELPGNEIMQGTMPGAHRRGRSHTPGWTTSIRGQDSPWKSQSE